MFELFILALGLRPDILLWNIRLLAFVTPFFWALPKFNDIGEGWWTPGQEASWDPSWVVWGHVQPEGYSGANPGHDADLVYTQPWSSFITMIVKQFQLQQNVIVQLSVSFLNSHLFSTVCCRYPWERINTEMLFKQRCYLLFLFLTLQKRQSDHIRVGGNEGFKMRYDLNKNETKSRTEEDTTGQSSHISVSKWECVYVPSQNCFSLLLFSLFWCWKSFSVASFTHYCFINPQLSFIWWYMNYFNYSAGLV